MITLGLFIVLCYFIYGWFFGDYHRTPAVWGKEMSTSSMTDFSHASMWLNQDE